MRKSIGFVEVKSIPVGIQTADEMLKAGNIEILLATPICPGKYVIIVSGQVGPVKAAMAKAEMVAGVYLIENYHIDNINEKVLPATIENGYGYGIIFVNGEKVPGLAGGICQVSSTLYNAVLEAGITADARTNHSMFVEYVPYGQDATMNDSGLDFKFTNPYDVPILIQATTSGSYLTISLWSAMDVLEGLDYKAYTEKINEKTYDTYLQAFNSEGVLISSKYLHRSIYR